MPSVLGFEYMMNSLLRKLLDALDSEEREAVAGDLLEANESLSASVFQVLGLLIRRQLAPWVRWQPWIVLATLALPLAAVLAQTARDFAAWSAVYSWMLLNNTDATLLRSSGFWYGARETSWMVGKFAFVLFSCSWACGRLIAQLSRNARFSMAILFVITSFFVNIVDLPAYARADLLHTNDRYFPNGAVFANVSYRLSFPLIVYAMTVLAPSFLGFMQTRPSRRQPRALSILFTCSTAVVVLGLVQQRWLLLDLWLWHVIPASFVSLPDLLPFASLGSECFLLMDLGLLINRHRAKRINPSA